MDRLATYPESAVVERALRECAAGGGAMSLRKCDDVVKLRSRMQAARRFCVVRESKLGIDESLHMMAEQRARASSSYLVTCGCSMHRKSHTVTSEFAVIGFLVKGAHVKKGQI